jgi:GT2 family glycosyltransferase
MLLAAWEGAWLEPAISASLRSIQEARPFLQPKLLDILDFCTKQPQVDPALTERLRPDRARDAENYEHMLDSARRRNDHPLFLLGLAVTHALREHRPAWLRAFLQRDEVLPPALKIGLSGDTLFAEGDYGQAAAAYARAHAALPFQVWEQRRAEALCRAGQRDEAIALLHGLHARRPWQINTLLRLSDLLMDRDRDLPFPPGKGTVLLYTWNKSQDMDATLASLAASELSDPAGGGEARIFALDNGSTDAVPEVLRKWEAHFAGRMSIVTLPVNIGAPAARNWLLALPEVRQADWAAFLDDDVAVPADWLRHLWGALRAYPDAGVSACHALDFHAPMSQQGTDMHISLLPREGGGRGFRDHFKFSAPHEQSFDFGEFTFMRPCVTAIGCCHLLTRNAMDEDGPFDIRFSPSQSDDVDHDMRACLAGRLPIYNGHLRVLHKRSTGYHKTSNRRGWASAVGNWYKLQASYSEEESARIFELDQKLMREDLRRRLAILREHGLVSGA